MRNEQDWEHSPTNNHNLLERKATKFHCLHVDAGCILLEHIADNYFILKFDLCIFINN